MAGLFDGTPLERPVTCERCGREATACTCPPIVKSKAGPSTDQRPRVRREKRRGKWNTVVGGLVGETADLKALLKTLQAGLGAGGGVSDGEIVIQGDHRDRVVAKLIELGYQAKAAGG